MAKGVEVGASGAAMSAQLRMSAEEWRFFEEVWLAGMAKVRLTDGWDSSDDAQRLVDAVDKKLMALKPIGEEVEAS